MSEKTAYICGPLTDLETIDLAYARHFYEMIAETYKNVTGKDAFLPHMHYDPVNFPFFEPAQVDLAERRQVCELTEVLIAVPLAPSWGGGIEIEMANHSSVPVLLICEFEKKISRLLLGNPAVRGVIRYGSIENALCRVCAIRAA